MPGMTLQLDPLQEQMDDPLTIACSINVLIAIYEPVCYVLLALRVLLADAPGATLRVPNRYPRT